MEQTAHIFEPGPGVVWSLVKMCVFLWSFSTSWTFLDLGWEYHYPKLSRPGDFSLSILLQIFKDHTRTLYDLNLWPKKMTGAGRRSFLRMILSRVPLAPPVTIQGGLDPPNSPFLEWQRCSRSCWSASCPGPVWHWRAGCERLCCRGSRWSCCCLCSALKHSRGQRQQSVWWNGHSLMAETPHCLTVWKQCTKPQVISLMAWTLLYTKTVTVSQREHSAMNRTWSDDVHTKLKYSYFDGVKMIVHRNTVKVWWCEDKSALTSPPPSISHHHLCVCVCVCVCVSLSLSLTHTHTHTHTHTFIHSLTHSLCVHVHTACKHHFAHTFTLPENITLYENRDK